MTINHDKIFKLYSGSSGQNNRGGNILKEVRFHGRGGQGIVTSADILAVACFKEGHYSLSFPTFGAEKRGTPVASFLRVSDKPIVLRDEIYYPDYVVVMDPTVIGVVPVESGIKDGGFIIANYPEDSGELKKQLNTPVDIYSLNATKLAMEELGRPITNTAMVGAFVGVSKIVSLNTLKETIDEWFKKKSQKLADKNVKLVETAYNMVQGG